MCCILIYVWTNGVATGDFYRVTASLRDRAKLSNSNKIIITWYHPVDVSDSIVSEFGISLYPIKKVLPILFGRPRQAV